MKAPRYLGLAYSLTIIGVRIMLEPMASPWKKRPIRMTATSFAKMMNDQPMMRVVMLAIWLIHRPRQAIETAAKELPIKPEIAGDAAVKKETS